MLCCMSERSLCLHDIHSERFQAATCAYACGQLRCTVRILRHGAACRDQLPHRISHQSLCVQRTVTTRAAVEFYGPDRAKWLGPLSDNATPIYLNGEFPGDYGWVRCRRHLATAACLRACVLQLSTWLPLGAKCTTPAMCHAPSPYALTSMRIPCVKACADTCSAPSLSIGV
jgi:hypothetical protein